MKFSKFAAVFTLTFIASNAGAVTVLTLNPSAAPGIQQSAQGPCVIGDPSCVSNAQLPEGFTTLPNGGNSYVNEMSPEYLVSNLRALLLSDLFNILIDVNGNSTPQTLSLFSMTKVGGAVLASYAPQTPTQIPSVNNNGNGFSDYVLSGFSLAGLANSDKVKFTVSMPVKNAGREQFFLQAVQPAPVPVPAAGLMLLAGLGALAAAKRRKTA